MDHQIFSIHDSKAEAYFPPFHLHNKSMAIRQFGDMVNDPTTQLSKHPADYTLFHLGNWNDQTAQYSKKMDPVSIGNGVEFLNEEFSST